MGCYPRRGPARQKSNRPLLCVFRVILRFCFARQGSKSCPDSLDCLLDRFAKGTFDRVNHWSAFGALGLVSVLVRATVAGQPTSDDAPLSLPAVGSYELRVITPNLLELTLIAKKDPDPARVEIWNFVTARGQPALPPSSEFSVTAGDRKVAVTATGFKRRALYAPLKQRDLRVANYLYLHLASDVPESATVKVDNPSHKLWPDAWQFSARNDPRRWNPALHVNQTGYLPDFPKKAQVGYYLGSLGELELSKEPASGAASQNAKPMPFELIDAASGKAVFKASLTPRRDVGFPYDCYQQVLEADFSPVKAAGEYQLFVPGLGVSFPFVINEGVAAAFARTYALGIYHQRCGAANELPFTRFTHKECHLAPAEVPTMSHKFESANDSLKKETANYKDNPRHTAPQLKSVAASLYPFQNAGPVDVHGGHHDAGDYSKYTINSASFIHHLVFAADTFPGAAELDNLGIPESGDGKSDLIEEAKWEADFLARMQDSDGGFYFLVYPRDREYESDVLPDHGDPQIVFPKTTAATAAATAALAQCSSSPWFKKQFPEAAAGYLEKARKGWAFLERAIAKYGKDGAYQKITHYGDEYMHDDELAWAACEMFLATGEEKFEKQLQQWLDPANPEIRKWGWWRLFDAYGCAIRSYAFAAKAGKIARTKQQPLLLEQCENEIIACGEDQLRRANNSAYGTSFPEETKRARAAGWYFSSDAAFDLAAACQMDYPIKRDPRPKMIEAILSNLNYEQGCNPVNVTYLTGLGSKRQREIVHQYAQNDRRVLPPSGIPLGNIQAGMLWLDLYKKEPMELSFPPDDESASLYPFYDRWVDGFNLSQEFVILNQARALGYLAWLMAQTSLKNQPWKSAAAQIQGLRATVTSQTKITLELASPGIDLMSARIIWEAGGQEPVFGKTFSFVPGKFGPQWVEAEAQLADGRRVFAVTNFNVLR